MRKKFSLPRGTSDILPSDVAVWQRIEQAARNISQLYGYKEIRTPLFEETALFSRSLGQTTDIVQKQMLNLQKEGLSLRPEGTASIVRSYIENNIDKKEAISKLYYIGPMFRGERPQKGRLRQFYQIGVEVIGQNINSPYLDAEVIALSVNMLKEFGLKEKDFKVKINTLGTLDDKKKFHVLLCERLKAQANNLCDDCKDRANRNPFRVLDCKNKKCKTVVEELDFGSDWLAKESKEYFQEVKTALGELGINFEECPDLVRGLDYYTGTVFEISSPSLGSQDALGAGGRYDTLVSQLGGPQADAIGFALGIERILLALADSKESSFQPLTTYLIALDEESFKKAFEILNILRSENIPSDISYRSASVKSQMRFADKLGTRSVIVIGENEITKQLVAVKNMGESQESKKEISVTIQNGDYSFLVDELKRLEERYK